MRISKEQSSSTTSDSTSYIFVVSHTRRFHGILWFSARAIVTRVNVLDSEGENTSTSLSDEYFGIGVHERVDPSMQSRNSSQHFIRWTRKCGRNTSTDSHACMSSGQSFSLLGGTTRQVFVLLTAEAQFYVQNLLFKSIVWNFLV